MEEKVSEKKKRNVRRSPNFPIVDLKSAIENVQKIYKADGRAGSRRTAIFKHLGYGGSHGVSRSTLSAMKKFGLLKEEGEMVYLTKEAEILVMSSDEEKKKNVIKSCALKPEIYKNLWEQYERTGFPSDHTLKDTLIWEYKFNEKSVDGFILNFRNTLSFAGIVPGEKIEENKEEEKGEEMKLKTGIPDLVHTTKTGDKVAVEVKIKDYLIPRKNDKVAILRLENPVNNEDIEFIQEWLNLLKKTIVTV